MTRRELVLRFVVREGREVPLGRTIVDFSEAIARVAQRAFTDEGVFVEASDVRGRELEPASPGKSPSPRQFSGSL